MNRELRRMGFKRKNTTYRLTFDGSTLDGLVVEMRSAPVGAILDMGLAVTAADGEGSTMKGIDRMLSTLADYLVSWNFEEEDGTPVSANEDGLRSLGMNEVMLLVQHWVQAAAGVSAPLDQPSSGGVPSEAPSLPMEALSPSLAS